MYTTWFVSSLLVTAAFAATDKFVQTISHDESLPSSNDNIVFITANAPQLVCQMGKDIAWEHAGGNEPDYELVMSAVVPYHAGRYDCRFHGDNSGNGRELFEKSIPRFTQVFRPSRYTNKWNFTEVSFDEHWLICLSDSDLPDDFFHLLVLRPHEKRPLKCRVRSEDGTLYLKFPGYPTVVCDLEVKALPPLVHGFNLPGIVEDPFQCAFLPYLYLQLGKTDTEIQLLYSLRNTFPTKLFAHPKFACQPAAASEDLAHFQLRVPGGNLYDCRILHLPTPTGREYFKVQD